MTNSPPAKVLVSAVAYPPGWRLVAGLLFFVSRASLVATAGMFLAGFLISPPLLVRIILFMALIPGLAAMVLGQILAATIEVRGGRLVIHRKGWFRRGRTVVLDPDAIERIAPWRLPLPGPGLSIVVVRQGRRSHLAVQTSDPAPLLDAMSAAGPAPPPAAQVLLTHARARAAAGIAGWPGLLLKFGVFGLLPVFVAFRLHQNVMYGGLLGQYHLHGLGPYLSTLAYYWVLIVIYLVLYATVLRVPVEIASLIAAWRTPARAETVRKWAESLARLLYYGGIPAYIVWRSLV